MNLEQHRSMASECFHTLLVSCSTMTSILATHSPMKSRDKVAMYDAMAAVRAAIKEAELQYDALYAKNAAAQMISEKIDELKETA